MQDLRKGCVHSCSARAIATCECSLGWKLHRIANDRRGSDGRERHRAERRPRHAPGPKGSNRCTRTTRRPGPVLRDASRRGSCTNAGPRHGRRRNARCARAAAELRAVEEQYARGLKKVASTLEGAAGPRQGRPGACAAAAAMLTSASEAHATPAKSLAADAEAPLEQARAAARKAQSGRRARAQAAHRAVKAADDRYRRAASEAQSPRAGRDRDRSREAGTRRGLGPRQRRRRASAGEAARVDLRQIPRAGGRRPRTTLGASASREWSDLSLESRKAALEAQRLLRVPQASDEEQVVAWAPRARKVGVHQASAFSTRNYDLAQLTRALDACDALADVRPVVDEREQARDRPTAPACGTRCGSASRRRRRSGARWEASSCRARPSRRAGLSICSRGTPDRAVAGDAR